MMKLPHALFGIFAACWLTAPALAALGGDATSVENDRASMKGAQRVVTPGVDYDVHEIQTSGGTVVREYVSLQGKVFAVTWRGPGIPDLRQVLGSYFSEFEQASSEPHYNHHHLAVRTPNVVVESSGHMRAFSGRAWAPALLPQNFSLKDLG
jgi:Protein of unknown function (DUF2844)